MICALALAGVTLQQAPVFVEVATSRDRPLVGEPFELILRIGVDPAFLSERMLQPFRRELDLPVQAVVPWWEGGDGLTVLPEGTPPDAARDLRSLVLGASVVEGAVAGRRDVGGTTYELVELRRVFLASADGELVLEAPAIRYATTSGFGKDLFGARVPLDRKDEEARGVESRLRVEPWPDAGRPPGFDGAVGRYEIEARTARSTIGAGEILPVEIRVLRAGPGAAFPRPDLHSLDRWRLAGVLEAQDGNALALRAEFEAQDAQVLEFPALAIAFLDPGPPPRYRTAASATIPLQPLPTPSPGPATAPAPRREAESLLRWPYYVIPALLLLLAGIAGRRARRAEPADATLAGNGTEHSDPAEELAAAAALCLRCPPAAAIAPDLEARLLAAAVPPPLAARAARLLEECLAARYGGPRRPEAAAEARAAAQELAQLRPRP